MSSVREGVPNPPPKMALKVLQINLNVCEAAPDLLTKTVREKKVNVVIIAEQYMNLGGLSWKTDATSLAAIWACGKHPFQEVMEDPGDIFVRVKISGMHFYSCYMPLSMSQEMALKAAIKAAPEMFLDIYNTCLAEGIFPERWKRQRLVLLPKNIKPPDDISSHRPLCMLDAPGKMLERFIFNRIETAVGHLLADNQYGFRKVRSTLDAVN